MPANLNDDLTPDEKERTSPVIERMNQNAKTSTVHCANIESGSQTFSTVADNRSLKQKASEDFSNSINSPHNRESQSMEETPTYKMVRVDIHYTNEENQPVSPSFHDEITIVQDNHRQNREYDGTKTHFKQEVSNTIIPSETDTGTYNVEILCNKEKKNMNEGLSKDITVLENEKNSVLSFDTKLNPESCANMKNSICSHGNDDPCSIKKEFSNSKENIAESDAAETYTELYFTDPSLPKYFNVYVDGLKVCGDSRCSLDLKPNWLDVEKYQRGQKVALKYLFGLQFAQLLSLLVVLNGPGGAEPLIFTGKSDTPFKAFKRYLSTALRVRSWYLYDLWDPESEAHKNLKTVRMMHESLRKALQATDPKERNRRSNLSGRSCSGCPAIWSTLQEELQEDFQGTCPFPKISENEFKEIYKTRVCVNQTEMSITQFGFVGLFINYPAYFGAHNVTDEELDSFVHLWRCIGYLLGMEDKYNFCNGDLLTVRKRTAEFIELVAKPSFRRVTQDWEHMTRCVTEGISYYVPGVSFEVCLQYLCSMFGLYTPRLWAALTFRQKIVYYFTQLTFWFLIRLPGSLDYHNWIVEKSLKLGENASPSKLKEWEEKQYPYQKSSVCT